MDELGTQTEVDPKRRKRRWRQAAIFLAACTLYCVSFGSDLASGIPYAELLLDPCSGDLNSTTSPSRLNEPLQNGSLRNESKCGGFGQGASKTAWVLSTATAARFATSWVSGIAFDVVGARASAITGLLLFTIGCLSGSFAPQLYVLYLTRGILSGIGGGLLYNLPIAVIDWAFETHKKLLLALAFSSNGLGVIIFALAGREAIAFGGWPWYYRMICFFCLLSLLAVLSFPSQPRGKQQHTAQRSTSDCSADRVSVSMNSTNRSHAADYLEQARHHGGKIKSSFLLGLKLYRNTNFLLLLVVFILLCFVYHFPMLTIKHRAENFPGGRSADDGYLQVILLGAGTIVGGISAALAVEFLPLPTIMAQGIMMMCAGTACMLSALVTSRTGLLYFITLYSMAISATGSLEAVVLYHILPTELLPHAIGQLFFVCLLPILTGPPVAGWLYEVTGSYTLPVMIGGVMLIAGGSIELLMDIRFRRQQRQNLDEAQHPKQMGEGKGDRHTVVDGVMTYLVVTSL